MPEEFAIGLTFTDGSSLTDGGRVEEGRLDGPVLSSYGDAAVTYDPSDGKCHVTNGEALRVPGLTGQSFESVILGQAK